MPRDNTETNPNILEARSRSRNNQATLNIELALESNQSASSSSASAASVGNAASLLPGMATGTSQAPGPRRVRPEDVEP